MRMKTTFEMDDKLFKKAKMNSVAKGVTFKRFVTEAIEEKLKAEEAGSLEKPWMEGFGALSKLKQETRRIDLLIEEEFGKPSSD